jgi:hypothetical protein
VVGKTGERSGGRSEFIQFPVVIAITKTVSPVPGQTEIYYEHRISGVVMDGYVWFALKNPSDFPATMFWLSNGGRSAAPWNSRHTGRLGIVDGCSHFCDRVDISRKDLLRNLAIPTTRTFLPETPVTLLNIHAVVSCPNGFGKVVGISPNGNDEVTITDESGSSVSVGVDWTRL